jgi:hypothetical protein
MWLKNPLPVALILVLLWTAWRLAFLAHTGIPQPEVHDEFSYLLGADTFAHGRLANPPHPLGEFFESPHILMHPTYASKYQPGQALFLTLGQRLFGEAFYGVLIGNAFMLFTFCLMLFAWVPARWALVVSGMVGLCLWPGMYWTNSYWGGSVVASGGALVLLGVGLYRAKQTLISGITFAIGVLLLFWTRPFEGGVFTLVVLTVFAKELWRNRRASVFVAAVSMLALGGAWTCYYNQAVTGNPFRLPYLLHQRQYAVTPVFWFLPLGPEPAYSHPRLASYFGTNGWEPFMYKENGPGWRFLKTGLIHSLQNLKTPLGTVVLLTLLVPVAWRDPLFRKMAIVAGVFVIALTVETHHFAHYSAPVWATLALMIAIWAEHAWNLRIGRHPAGVALVLFVLTSPALVLLVLTSPAISVLPSRVSLLLQKTSGSFGNDSMINSRTDWPNRRAALIKQLSALDRRQLVIVRYPSPDWNISEEWVYNGADIDHQRVIFAHDLGIEQNRNLLNYYSDRTALLLTFDSKSGYEQIEGYPPQRP